MRMRSSPTGRIAICPASSTDERTVICVLTHDPKFDVPLLEVALRRPAAYIGAMGSRRTHDDRLARLREAGLTDGELSRLRSPIGLDLGARTPEETAIAIAAELIQLRWGGSGQPLTATTGRIHHRQLPELTAGRRADSLSAACGQPAVAGVSAGRRQGSRLGQPKALIVIGGQSLAWRGIGLLRDGGADPVIVVTGAAGPGSSAPARMRRPARLSVCTTRTGAPAWAPRCARAWRPCPVIAPRPSSRSPTSRWSGRRPCAGSSPRMRAAPASRLPATTGSRAIRC